MRSASVGQQCVDCIQESNQGVRPAKNVFGSRRRPASTGAVVTFTLIGINLVLFLIELARPSLGTDWAMLGYALYPGGGAWHGVAAGEWYRLLTSAFLPPAVTGGSSVNYQGLLDIAFNMWALTFVGPAIEHMLGRLRFVGVYLISAIGGSVMYYYLAPQNQLALGASGAIFGLFAALFVLSRRLRFDARAIVAVITINLVISFVWAGSIAWQAHVGGLLAGGLITAAYVYAPRKNQSTYQAAATLAIVAAVVIAVVLRTHQLAG